MKKPLKKKAITRVGAITYKPARNSQGLYLEKKEEEKSLELAQEPGSQKLNLSYQLVLGFRLGHKLRLGLKSYHQFSDSYGNKPDTYTYM